MIWLIIGILFFSTYAFVLKKLTLSGAIAAFIVGSVVAVGFQYGGVALLAFFFISANLFSTLRRKKEDEVDEVTEKGDNRDAFQVIANGGVPAFLAIMYLFIPSPFILCGFIASMAAVTADTWASEVGVLNKQQPVHLLKWKRVPPGTSGAMTALGTSAAIVGSFMIVGIAIFFWGSNYYNSHLLLIALTAAGFIGNLFDTLIGASFQVEYKCPVCGIVTERKIHCNERSERMSGLTWMNNDMVNLSCSIIGALLGIGVGLLYF